MAKTFLTKWYTFQREYWTLFNEYLQSGGLWDIKWNYFENFYKFSLKILKTRNLDIIVQLQCLETILMRRNV